MHTPPHNIRESGNEGPSEGRGIGFGDPPCPVQTGVPPDPMGPAVSALAAFADQLSEILSIDYDDIDLAVAPTRATVQALLEKLSYGIGSRATGKYPSPIPQRIVLPPSPPAYLAQAVAPCNELLDFVNAFVLNGVQDVSAEIALMTAVLGQLGIALNGWPPRP